MKRQQAMQILQFLVAWILVWLFVVFVLELSFVDVVLEYRLYFLIVSVSYFYYYSIQYETDKKFDFIRNAIIWGNVYLFAHLFFRPLLNISHELFVLLWLIILWLRWTTKMKSKRKGLLQILWWVFIFFILISGMFYLYPDEPDIEGFIQSRKNELFVSWIDKPVDKSDAYLQISRSKRSDQFQIVPNFSQVLMEDCQIAYPSLQIDRDEKFTLLTQNGEVFIILPQSEAQILFSWDKMSKVIQNNWRIWFLSGMFESSLEIDWDLEDPTPENLEFMQWIFKWYQVDLVNYLKNQISDSKISLAHNTVMYKIDWTIIKFLAKMFPTSFSKNLRNYNSFQYYFSLVQDDVVDLSRYNMWDKYWNSVDSFWNSVWNNVKLWKWNLYDVWKKH